MGLVTLLFTFRGRITIFAPVKSPAPGAAIATYTAMEKYLLIPTHSANITVEPCPVVFVLISEQWAYILRVRDFWVCEYTSDRWPMGDIKRDSSILIGKRRITAGCKQKPNHTSGRRTQSNRVE
jgi:hypothetical protein